MRKKWTGKLLCLKWQSYLYTSQKLPAAPYDLRNVLTPQHQKHALTPAYCCRLNPAPHYSASPTPYSSLYASLREVLPSGIPSLFLPGPPLAPYQVPTWSTRMGQSSWAFMMTCVTLFISSVVCPSLGAGSKVPSALASMAMARLHTSYHCRRIPHTCHRGSGGRSPHLGILGPRGHLLLGMGTAHPPTSSLHMGLCTKVTVALVLDCRPLRPPSTSCLWPMTKASLQRRVSSTARKQAATMLWGPMEPLRTSPSLCDPQLSRASEPIASTSCATLMWVHIVLCQAWRRSLPSFRSAGIDCKEDRGCWLLDHCQQALFSSLSVFSLLVFFSCMLLSYKVIALETFT
jgi:hypothetical protein